MKQATSFFEHVVSQYPPDIRTRKYKYWDKLRIAQSEYSKTTGDETPEGFCKWMQERWGIKVGTEAGGYSPWFDITDENKYLLFTMKYGSI